MLTIKARKLLPTAKLPTKAGPHEAGWDFYTPYAVDIFSAHTVTVDLGLALEIPPCWALVLKDRSSLGRKGLSCHGGVIDCTYRGEVSAVFHNHSADTISFSPGDRVCQGLLVQVYKAGFVEAEDLAPSDRGTSGFGSTGK